MFKNNTKYQIITNSLLLTEDYKFVTKYYQPFIGPIATLIYLNFLNDLGCTKQTEMFGINRLQTYINTTLDKLNLGIKVLSKVGLLNIYKSNIGDEFIFEIINPKPIDEFFADVNLIRMLKQNLSEEIFLSLESEVNTIPFNFNGYIKLNSEYKTIADSNDVVGRSAEKNPYTEYFNSLGVTNNKAEINDLIIISSANNLTRVEIESILPVSMEGKKILIEKFVKAIELMREEPKFGKEKVVSREETLRVFDSYDSELFLMKINNGRALSKYEKDLITLLRNDYMLPDPVINVLIDYVLLINDKNLNKPFVETIAANWSRKRFETSQQAMDFVKDYNKKRVERSEYSGNIVPEWLESEKNSNEESNVSSRSVDDLFAGFEGM